MNESAPRFWEVFFDVFEHLPRQGPGNRASAERALGLCRELSSSPVLPDLDCILLGQTFQFGVDVVRHCGGMK